MARRLEEDLDVTREEPKPSRKRAEKSNLSWWRVSAWALLGFCILGAGLYAFYLVEKFLILDSRFALNGPDGSEDAQQLSVSGATYASASAVKAVFREDLGKSVYVLPMSDRREQIRQVAWVKDAALARMWPNRVSVRISERVPVAFVPLAKSGYQLIDEEGILLPAVSARFRLPVVRGISVEETQPRRKELVRRLLRVLEDLGTAAAAELSEVDVSDKDNIKLLQPSGQRLLTLLLGDQNFAGRYQNFKQHFAEIQRRLPDAATLDLRLEDRITVVQ